MKTNRLVVAAIALAVLPALGAAQTDTGQAQRGGAGRRGGGAGAQGSARGNMGGNMGLTSDQITQLQQSLSDMGCYRGSVDGVMGPQTRRGLSCARRQKNIEGNNANELFRAMNLDITVEDSMGMGGVMRSGASGREQRSGSTGERTGEDRAVRDTSGGAGGSQTADSAAGNRRQGAASRGRSGAAGNNAGRRGGRDSAGAARPPRRP
jgi:hypothetical protein